MRVCCFEFRLVIMVESVLLERSWCDVQDRGKLVRAMQVAGYLARIIRSER